jgi:transcriptional regulator with XRE-family HTH domain
MPQDDGEWRRLLKQARLQLRVTQAQLARSTGTSYEAIRAYEGGKRRPSPARLEAMIEALKIPNADANRIREAAGFAPVHDIRTGPLERNRFYHRDELDAVVETVPWPEFVVNDPVEVLAVNRAKKVLQEGVQVTSRHGTPPPPRGRPHHGPG